jgi:hypothetical protein
MGAEERWNTVALSFVAKPPQSAVVALALLDPDDGVEPSISSSLLTLPRLLAELTAMQRYVLARAATHSWTYGGLIPFLPGTPHQGLIALSLSTPPLPLFEIVMVSHRRTAFRLSRLGERAARCVLKVVPAEQDWAREEEFDRMRALMRNRLETSDETSDDQ